MQTQPQPPPISRRELEVARAYTGGKTYREIANELHIAPATVRTHINNIYRKLGVTSKIELLHSIEAPAVTAPARAPRKGLFTVIGALILAALAGAFMMTADPEPSLPVPPAQSIALVAFQFDGNPTMRDALVRDMVDGLSQRAELFVIQPSNSQHSLTREKYAKRLSNGINMRFVLMGKTASHGGTLTASAALYDRAADQIIWQGEAQSAERNSLAIRLALLGSLSKAINLPRPAQAPRRCFEMIESDTHVYQDGAPAPIYLFQGQQQNYCGPDEVGPR